MTKRVTAILDSFTDRVERLTLEEVMHRSHLPKSTVHRILDQLIKIDWVRHAPYGYSLGERAVNVGGHASEHDRIRYAAAPLLHELHFETGLVVHLVALEGTNVQYLDKRGGRSAAAVPTRVGARRAAHTTAGGKALLAGLYRHDWPAIGRRPLRRYTDRTIVDTHLLQHELVRVWQRGGIAFDKGESARGFECVGGAIKGYDNPIAAVSLCAPMHARGLERFVPALVAATQKISAQVYPDASSRFAPTEATASRRWSLDALERIASVQRDRWL